MIGCLICEGTGIVEAIDCETGEWHSFTCGMCCGEGKIQEDQLSTFFDLDQGGES